MWKYCPSQVSNYYRPNSAVHSLLDSASASTMRTTERRTVASVIHRNVLVNAFPSPLTTKAETSSADRAASFFASWAGHAWSTFKKEIRPHVKDLAAETCNAHHRRKGARASSAAAQSKR
jgi:hypothetical protein